MRYLEIDGGARLSAIGLGTGQFGDARWGFREEQRAEAVRVVRRALELGMNLVDTAEIYGGGTAEELVGEAVAGRRGEAFLATKVFPRFPLPARIRRAAAGSLRRLGTEVLDLYQLHWFNRRFPLRLQVRGLRQLQDSGAVRHVGVSNFGLAAWRRAERALGRPVLSNQVEYSLLSRGPESAVLPWARAAGRVVIAHTPLVQGLLTGKYDEVRQPPSNPYRSRHFEAPHVERALRVVALLREIGSGLGATPGQVALAWLVHQPGVVAIPGAKTVRQVEENAAAAQLVLGDDALDALHRATTEG